MNNNLTTVSPNAVFLLPADADKNLRSSVGKFVSWLDDNALSWVSADLRDYLDYLNTCDLSQATVKKHMERVRARYKDMQHSNAVRDMIQAQLPASTDAANAYAVTQEVLTRIQNNTEYNKRLEVKLTTITAKTDDKFTWLSYDDINAIFARIPDTPLGLRDAAIFALCLSYGLREAEACSLTVEDMGKLYKGSNGVEVREGKGNKQRFVIHDELTDYTAIVRGYLDANGITRGLVLSGLKPRQLQNRVKLYTTAKPHDLRRTYAKLLHNGGRSIEFIGQQLGHAKLETTLIYLGVIRT